jgi:hypothetical protein
MTVGGNKGYQTGKRHTGEDHSKTVFQTILCVNESLFDFDDFSRVCL